MNELSCAVCGSLGGPRRLIFVAGIYLCHAHIEGVLWTMRLPEHWLERMTTEGLHDHHTDADFTPALRHLAGRCKACGSMRLRCWEQLGHCCDQCTHPRATLAPKGKPS